LGQARLTTLLSPVLSVSSDRDLVDYGFAVKARWTIAHAAQLQLEAEGSYMAVVLPGGLVWAGFDSAFQAAGSAWGKPGKLLVSVATVSGIWLLVRAVRKADPPTRAKLLGVIETVMQMLAEANEKHQRAENQLAQALIYASGMSERLVADIAAALATSTEPLTATQLSRDLWTTEGPVPQTFLIEIQHQLSSLPAFVQVGRYGWDLGRRAAFVQVN
jgi:hypothetical protein